MSEDCGMDDVRQAPFVDSARDFLIAEPCS